jgi:exodeoxyribonuclease-5
MTNDIDYEEIDKAKEELNEGQLKAFKQALFWWKVARVDNADNLYFRIFGYAGTGKSYIVQYITSALGIGSSQIVYCAFTGNAALNLVRKGNNGACTIHRLQYDVEVETIQEHNDKNDPERVTGEKKIIHTIKKEHLDPNIKLIIVDEISMVSDTLINDLLSFNIPIMMLGDPGQLESPGGVNSYMGDSEALLDEIVRQDNFIVNASFWARTGYAIPYGMYGDNNEVSVIPDYYLDDEDDANSYYKWADTIIVGKNKTRKAINKAVRKAYDRKGNFPVVGDKLVCNLNQWDITAYCPSLKAEIALVNGTVGYVKAVKAINMQEEYFIIDFQTEFDENCVFEDLKISSFNFDPQVTYFPSKKNDFRMGYSKFNNFDYGYGITCHKAEGNEYNKVLIIVEKMGWNFETKRYDINIDMKWLYTAITRAKKKVILVMKEDYYKNTLYDKSDEYWDSIEEYY